MEEEEKEGRGRKYSRIEGRRNEEKEDKENEEYGEEGV